MAIHESGLIHVILLGRYPGDQPAAVRDKIS
jgi:hypothetical protein